MNVLKRLKFNKLTFELRWGDLTKCKVHVVVNAANKYLKHYGGVALAIAKAATGGNPEKYIEISKKELTRQVGKDHIEPGEVVVTPSLRLEKYGIKYVIHTVGPKCSGKWNYEYKKVLKKALKKPLEKAEELKVESIAFPAISAGIYGCPLKKVVKTFVEVIKDFSTKASSLKLVMLVIYDQKSAKETLNALDT